MGSAVDGCGGRWLRRWMDAAVNRCGDAVAVDQYATPPGMAFFLLTVICTSPLFGSILLARNGSYGSCCAFGKVLPCGGGYVVQGRIYRAGQSGLLSLAGSLQSCVCSQLEVLSATWNTIYSCDASSHCVSGAYSAWHPT
jgi:hypothetical protein